MEVVEPPQPFHIFGFHSSIQRPPAVDPFTSTTSASSTNSATPNHAATTGPRWTTHFFLRDGRAPAIGTSDRDTWPERLTPEQSREQISDAITALADGALPAYMSSTNDILNGYFCHWRDGRLAVGRLQTSRSPERRMLWFTLLRLGLETSSGSASGDRTVVARLYPKLGVWYGVGVGEEEAPAEVARRFFELIEEDPLFFISEHLAWREEVAMTSALEGHNLINAFR
ncbi:hypothetical protein CAC42_2715 [Sphaceloma murrayae]|uniref:Uncharacterized protein n=1 Tax=Sphaceloma murrayae TaxID=2082308 RepID=A0A2K1R0G5_9PEZI|nr:hypothetical protein CAC42_2715 [Sphaceloma murrayae]